jgi:uncharacterized alpha-E superfamily protein
MLSRVAETIYWMARYIERAENTARLIAVNANLLMDLPKGVAPGWAPLTAIMGSDEDYRARNQDYSERQILKFLIGDGDNPGSILSSLTAARENCRTIRDIVPREAWEQINALHLDARDGLEQGLTKRGRYDYLRRIVLGSQTITGLLAGTMNHDEGYQFLRIGRNLERADMTTRIIDVRSANLVPQDTSELRPFDTVQWMSVLKSLTAYQMYRRSMQVRVSRAAVLRFLFQGDEFPRSVRHCVAAVEASVATLAHNEGPLRVLGRLKRAVMGTEVDHLSQSQLHTFIDDLQIGLGEVHDELSKPYFLPPVSAAPGG